MAITRIKNSTIGNRTPKYNDVLAGLPYIPIIGTASDGGNGTSASVAFTGNNVANGTITYTALSSPGSFTGTGTASPITVSGLTSGTAYTFQVKAGNSLGDSAYSSASNSVTPVTPTAFDSIATVTAAGGETSLTFSSIPGTYKHLHIRGISQDTNTLNVAALYRVEFNGSSATDYSVHRVGGDGASVTVSGTATVANITLQNASTRAYTGMTSAYGASIIDIIDYASTTKAKVLRAFTGSDANSAAPYWVNLHSGLWNSTAAITSVKLIAANSWSAGTTFALYGIKGA